MSTASDHWKKQTRGAMELSATGVRLALPAWPTRVVRAAKQHRSGRRTESTQ
jgi:hypothetical protein